MKDHIDLEQNPEVIAYREEKDPNYKARMDTEGNEFVSRKIESDLKEHNDDFIHMGLPFNYDQTPFMKAH